MGGGATRVNAEAAKERAPAVEVTDLSAISSRRASLASTETHRDRPSRPSGDSGRDGIRMKQPSACVVGVLLLALAAAPAAGAAPAEGEVVYAGTCQRCHGTGEYGAPRFGDRAAWQPRFQRGMDDLMDHTIDGLRAMPPRGGNDDLTDAQLRSAIVHMLRAAGFEVE